MIVTYPVFDLSPCCHDDLQMCSVVAPRTAALWKQCRLLDQARCRCPCLLDECADLWRSLALFQFLIN